jgi:hypothetical protein
LLDSGSSNTFISGVLAAQLSGVSPLSRTLSVQVADGAVVACTQQFKAAEWEVQGYKLCSDFTVLPLLHFDVILGYDWLECFSPMKVHWSEKWIAIPYGAETVLLQGILSELKPGAVVQVFQSSQDPVGSVPNAVVNSLSVSEDEMLKLPIEVQKLLHSYADIFASKVSFPPPHACTHSIPLIEGARPVSIRPYRYAPALKDEIENQVKEMLAAGLIQNSNSSFSSPVLLVKKKDNSCRFCVDYRHLNAITVKGQFPVPVIDEFLDELKGASWFSSLDLCSGFYQIPMDPVDCFKTAFQTNNGHYEFKVISFGLTGAPHSFQKAMNSTLAPLLRKCALVFFDDILIYSQSYEDHVSHLEQVFMLLKQEQWYVKLAKCSFAVRGISYLGYVISAQGVST